MRKPNHKAAREDAEKWIKFETSEYTARLPEIDSFNLALCYADFAEHGAVWPPEDSVYRQANEELTQHVARMESLIKRVLYWRGLQEPEHECYQSEGWKQWVRDAVKVVGNDGPIAVWRVDENA